MSRWCIHPRPVESVKHGVPGSDELKKFVADRCVALGITNIRVMKRIVRFVEDAQPILAKLSPRSNANCGQLNCPFLLVP